MNVVDTHLGIIPDGNRRYARKHGLEYQEAYKLSKNNLLAIIDDAMAGYLDLGRGDIEQRIQRVRSGDGKMGWYDDGKRRRTPAEIKADANKVLMEELSERDLTARITDITIPDTVDDLSLRPATEHTIPAGTSGKGIVEVPHAELNDDSEDEVTTYQLETPPSDEITRGAEGVIITQKDGNTSCTEPDNSENGSNNTDSSPVERVNELSIYLLSEENLRRPDGELRATYDMFLEELSDFQQRYDPQEVDLNWATTRPEALPSDVQKALSNLEETYNGSHFRVNMLFSYSGKQDIIQATQSLHESHIEPTEESLKDNLEFSTPIDYVIRTGDNPTRECLSGFALWQASYAEYFHLQRNFPAITRDDIFTAIRHFEQLRRKKGE